LLGPVGGVQLEAAAQHLDDGQERRDGPVGDRARLEDEPVRRHHRMREFPAEPRLADAGLADQRDHLAVPLVRALQRVGELAELLLPGDERSQAADEAGPQARAGGPGAGQLVDLDGSRQAPYRGPAKRSQIEVALDQARRVGCHQHAARIGELLHPGR
jgi:hypothetical protein